MGRIPLRVLTLVGSTIIVLMSASCGGGSDTSPKASPTVDETQLLRTYVTTVLLPAAGGKVTAYGAFYDGLPYRLDSTKDYAVLAEEILFNSGDSALKTIDRPGVDSLSVWPICIAGIAWTLDVSAIGAHPDVPSGDLLKAILRATQTTRDLDLAVKSEAYQALPPSRRLDPARCHTEEQAQRKARGLPTRSP
jgi:hypothetical protein